MAAKKPLVVSSGGVEQIQAGDSLDALNVTSGADPGHTHSIYLKADGSVPLTSDWTTGIFNIIGSDHWYMRADSKRIYFGASDDCSIYWHDGSKIMIFDGQSGDGFYFTSGKVGIGKWSTSNRKLNVYDANTAAGPCLLTSLRLVYGTSGGANVNYISGMQILSETNAIYDGDVTGYIQGYTGQIIHRGTGLVAVAVGGSFNVTLDGTSGTITKAYGLSMRVANTSDTGTIRDAYGFFVNDITVGTLLNYAIYTGAGQVRIGDDLFFAGAGSGLPYGMICGNDLTATITITNTGIANKVQILVFDTDGVSNLVTPDHTNDHITIVKTGIYYVSVNIHTESVGGVPYAIGFGVYKNNGANAITCLSSHRHYSGGGSDCNSTTISGLASLTAANTLELWCWNETNTANIVVEDVTLTAVMVGG